MALLEELKTMETTHLIASGITEKTDLIKAYEMGATYAGFIFVLTSPYGVAIEKAVEIAEDSPIELMGIFQNADIADIVYVVEQIKLSAVVLNGWEPQKFISDLRVLLPQSIKIIKIAHLKDDAPKMNYQDVDFYLLGGHVGEVLEPNWALLDRIDLSNVFLSGNWENHSQFSAIQQQPLGIELNVKM